MLVMACPVAAWLAAPAQAAESSRVPTAQAAESSRVPTSAYERQALDAALGALDAEIDPSPQGKRIEAVLVRVLDVVEPRDPLPDFLNIFHTNTEEYVVARELLVDVGDRYRHDLVDESQRNLRSLRQHSLVLCVPLRGGRDDTVRLLVLVKDIWSLRLNSNFRFKGGQLEYLFLQPAEENLAGTHRRVLGAFVYQPATLAFGGRLVEPRIAGSRYAVSVDANVIVNQQSGQAEGSYGFFHYGLPLYSTRARWGWGVTIDWRREVTRRYLGTAVAEYDAAATAELDRIPYLYDTDELHGQGWVTRSFGRRVKHDLQLGLKADRDVYRASDLSGHEPAAAAEFVDQVLPVSDTRMGPYVQYHVYLNRFRSLLHVESLGLGEDYALGPQLYARAQPVLRGLGSSRDLLGLYGAVLHTQAVGNGLVRSYATADVFVDAAEGELPDVELTTGLRVLSPRLGFGRLISDTAVLHRPRNYLNRLTALGGGGRLRGYPSDYLVGQDMIAANLELRTRPIALWTVQLAGALFYDVADAFDGWARLEPKQGAGFGLRLVFPMLERAVTRIDWGFALPPHHEDFSVVEGLVVTFRQAFGMPLLTSEGVNLAPR